MCPCKKICLHWDLNSGPRTENDCCDTWLVTAATPVTSGEVTHAEMCSMRSSDVHVVTCLPVHLFWCQLHICPRNAKPCMSKNIASESDPSAWPSAPTYAGQIRLRYFWTYTVLHCEGRYGGALKQTSNVKADIFMWQIMRLVRKLCENIIFVVLRIKC